MTSLGFLDFGVDCCFNDIALLAAGLGLSLAGVEVDPAGEAGRVSDAEECASSLAG